jgi:ferrous iron transport protein A
MEKRTTLAELNIGESAEIAGFQDKKLSLKLLEMGCLPGAWVKLNSEAPLGDPITICIGGSHVSMRRSEAATVLVHKK